MTSEHVNFLASCWRNARFRDAIVFWLHPARGLAYRLGRRFARSAAAPAISAAKSVCAVPQFTSGVRPVFETPLNATEDKIIESLLRADQALFMNSARQQLQGLFRLAGATVQKVDFAPLISVEGLENRHSFHRLYWAVRYAQAAAAGDHPCTAALYRDLQWWLDHFAAFDPVSRAAYTTAERIANLTEVLFWAGRKFPPEFVIAVKQQIFQDAQALSGNIEYHLGVHNHLLNDARGLYIAAKLLGGAEGSSWEQQAFEIWERYFPQLVLADGSFIEQSSHYHLLLCRTALEYTLAARHTGRGVPPELMSRLRRMFLLADNMLRPDGSLARFGDNSPDHIIEELWGLLTAARFHGLLDRSPRHGAVTPLTIYYGAVRSLEPPPPAPTTSLYTEGGWAFLRTDDGLVEMVAHGDPTSKLRSHGDAGQGSFELFRRGRVIIREPGCYQIPAQDGWFQSAAAQNVTRLNGLGPALSRADARRLPDWYNSHSNTWRSLLNGGVQFECRGYERVRPGLRLIRTWSLDMRGDLHFEEVIEGTGNVEVTSQLFLGEGDLGPVQTNASGRCWQISLNTRAGESATLSFSLPSGVQASLERGRITPEYGIERETTMISLKGMSALPIRWTLACDFRVAGLELDRGEKITCVA